MATKKKQSAEKVETSGVPVRTFEAVEQVNRYAGGVPVRTPETPAQTAGSDNGQSAGNEEN